jgi:transglutaminase-like putative cysteine protease
MSQRLQFAAALIVFAAALRLEAGYSKTQDFRPATPQELAMTSAPGAPGAPAAILDWVRIDDDNYGTSAEYKRIKIFTDEGKKYADVEVTYVPGYPFFGRIAEVGGRTIHPDGTIVPFDGKVYDRVLFKGRGVRVHAKTFTLSDVQPGSIIEYRFTSRWEKNVVLGAHWSLQHDVPVLRAKLSLVPYKGGEFNSFFTYSGLPAGKVPARVNDRFELEMENIPAFEAEDLAPPEQQLRSYVNFHYTYSRLKPEEFWPAEAQNWSKRIENFIGNPNQVKSVAQTLTGANARETATKIYAYVQSLRNYSFEESKTEQELDRQSIGEAKNAGEVVKNKAGYRDELNRTFIALARAAGLPADAVRVAPRDEFFFSMKLPDGEQMSGEVAVVTIDGTAVFVDPGTPLAPFGTLAWEKSNVPGIRVSKGQQPTWIITPQNDPKDAMVKRTADLKIDGETLTGTVTATFSGQEALQRRLRNLTDDEAARKKAFEEEAQKWFAEGASVTLTNLTGATSFDDAMTATYAVTLPNFVSSAGSRTVVPISVFASSGKNPFAATTRKHPIYFDYPRTEEDEVKLTVPESMKVSAVPSPTKMDAGSLGYASDAKADGNTVTFKRSAFVKVMLIEAQHYGPLRSFYSAMLTADQKPLVLVAKE